MVEVHQGAKSDALIFEIYIFVEVMKKMLQKDYHKNTINQNSVGIVFFVLSDLLVT